MRLDLRRCTAIPFILTTMLLVLTPFPSLRPVQAASSIEPPNFDTAQMKASMINVYKWVVSRTLLNGTATLTGTSNNLLSTSLVGRVLTYLQLEIGNATSLALLNKMVDAEHLMLQNPRYITLGPWATQNISAELQIHRDVQKFLTRAYGLTLSQTARSDFADVTQDIYLNRPNRYEYFDTLAWGLANSVWFAYEKGSPLPPSTDFIAAVQDLNQRYNKSAALADSANPFVDYSRLMHYLVPLEYTDGYFRLQGNSLDQTYLSLESQLAKQLLTRQMPNGNVSSLKPYKPYLVEDFARDLDSAYYLNNNLNYVSGALKSESFLTGLYLQRDGSISIPGRGEGFDPIIASHLISIGVDIGSSSISDSYSALSQASRIVNYTLSIQNPDGTFSFYVNSTNPGFAFTTIASVSVIVDSDVAIRSTHNPGAIGSIVTTASSQSVSSASKIVGTNTGGTTSSGSVTTTGSQSTSSATYTTGKDTGSSSNAVPGNESPLQSNPLSHIPSWAIIAVPIVLLILVAMLYENGKRVRYRGLVDK